ncbi:helix-turn-helix domain-containing protein [Catalinimonas niigatensis]|uniref:helix-turn-helix domain-containing protein n=1 Tax=Catalinimonas niigatensis TaxID=1397264 RepID=UPI002665E66D|nr:helix-turn-helix domain-containing protein [Catalinimonas niigatensis]WPP48740.1 helix-turn-helix domain-containing protein [Catalinimonas niigatensis]
MNTITKFIDSQNYQERNKPSLALNKFQASMPFEIHTIDWMKHNRWQQKHQPSKQQRFEIIWIKQGSGTLQVDLNKIKIVKNAIYGISPGQLHLIEETRDLKGISISFSIDFVGLLDHSYELIYNTGIFNSFSQSPIVHQCKGEEMIEIVDKMIKEFDNYFLFRAEILKRYLQIFLIYLARQNKNPNHQNVQLNHIHLVNKFLNLLDKNYTSKKLVGDYAAELCITPSYMNEIVKKATGIPASEHIKKRIILEAKRQALYTKASMKEIAFNLGFTDPSHFSKFFKNACHVNFSKFKNELMMS